MIIDAHSLKIQGQSGTTIFRLPTRNSRLVLIYYCIDYDIIAWLRIVFVYFYSFWIRNKINKNLRPPDKGNIAGLFLGRLASLTPIILGNPGDNHFYSPMGLK